MPKSVELFSFWDHLDELKGRLFKVLIVFLICCFGCWQYISPLLSFVIQPVPQLVFTSPGDAFTAQIKLAILAGFLFSLPYSVYHLWQFMVIGLKGREKRFVKIFGPLSLLCFLVGVVFAWLVVIPFSLRFLLGFASDRLIPMITINEYISFVSTMVFAFGAIFELPLVLTFLATIGIATPEFLIQKRRHAIVLIFIASAIITPPDMITLCLMALPLIILYEVGLWSVKWTYRQKHKEDLHQVK